VAIWAACLLLTVLQVEIDLADFEIDELQQCCAYLAHI
jgi:hypothetical protein